MNLLRRLTAAAALLAIFAVAAEARPRVVGYVPNWIDLPSFAETIDYSKVTHLNIAFENPTNAEGDLSYNTGNDALLAKARKHGVKVLVSIGGGAASGDKVFKARYAALLAEDRRPAFAAKLAAYVEKHGFDGLDVDIEGPSIDGNYGAFIADLSAALKPKEKLLTSALSQGYGGDRVPVSALAHFDFVNIMAYDGTGPWEPKAPGQHSSLAMAKDAVAWWLARGLAKEKAVLGVPFYGYGFGAAFRKHDYPYKEIVATFPGAGKVDEVGSTIWYNGVATIRAKCEFARTQGISGIMIWSLDLDAKGEDSLLGAIHETLNPPK